MRVQERGKKTECIACRKLGIGQMTHVRLKLRIFAGYKRRVGGKWNKI